MGHFKRILLKIILYHILIKNGGNKDEYTG